MLDSRAVVGLASVISSLGMFANGVTGGLRGVKIVMVDPVDDQRPSATPIFLGDCEKPSTGPAITLLTP